MAYSLKEITIRADNTEEGKVKIKKVWDDVLGGKIPLLFDNKNNPVNGVIPISKYSNYESDESGGYDLTIKIETTDFFEKMDEIVKHGSYKKYIEEGSNGDLVLCTMKNWEKVWSDNKLGIIKRAFDADFEICIPTFNKNENKIQCILYISLK